MNKQILYEYFNFYANSKYYLMENFADFTKKMMKSFSKDDLLWNIFDKKPDELEILDREETFTLQSLIKNK